jgi:hypothetical protein
VRDTRAQLGDIHAPRKPKNSETGCKPRKMGIEIADPAATNRHRFEQTIAEQETAIADRNMRILRRNDPAILPDAHH